MNSFLSKSLLQGRRIAREDGAIEQAAAAAATADTLDPEQRKLNDTFESEIKKLQEQNASTDTPAAPEGSQGEQAGGSAPESTTDTPEAGTGDEGEIPAIGENASVTDEEQGQAEAAVDQEVANGEGKPAADPEEAAATDPGSEKVERALEALATVGTHFQTLRQTHENGVIRPIHINLARESMNSQARLVGVRGVSFAREDGIVSNVVAFIARLLKAIRDFAVNIFKWVADVFRGWQARKGVYSNDEAGIKDRIKSLKDTHANVPSNEKTETISIPKLLNWHGTDIQSVMKAVNDLDNVQNVVLQGVSTQELADVFHGCISVLVNGLSTPGQDLASAVAIAVGKTPPIDEKVIFGRFGANTGFGNDPFFRDSVQSAPGSVQGTRVVAVSNLIGANAIRWTIQDAGTDNIERYATSVRAMDCMVGSGPMAKSAKGSAEIKLLSTIEEIEQTMAYRQVIEERATKLLELSRRTTAFSKKLSDTSAAALRGVEALSKAPGIDPTILANLGVTFGSAPEAYNRLATSSLAKIAGILMSVCDGLSTLTKASMAAIDKKMGQSPDKGNDKTK